jgi:truncated hemoglobin YjbI
MPDIRDRDDILVLRTFYETAFQDPMIGPIFTEVAHGPRAPPADHGRLLGACCSSPGVTAATHSRCTPR